MTQGRRYDAVGPLPAVPDGVVGDGGTVEHV